MADRDFCFSSGACGTLLAALPMWDIVSDKTRALSSGFSFQTTLEVFQSLRNLIEIVVCPLVENRLIIIKKNRNASSKFWRHKLAKRKIVFT